MREDILKSLQKEIYERCQKETNKFGMGCYYHIVAVVKNAESLADKYKADKEVVMIAGWLHDIASITDYSLYELHHVYGAKMAYNILKEYNYDDKKIFMVQECIKSHRGSVNLRKIVLKSCVLLMLMRFLILIVYPVYCIWLMFKEEWESKKVRNL